MFKQSCRNNSKARLTRANLKQPLHYRIMKNTSIGLSTFLITFISFSTLSPVESTDAAEVLLANQSTGGSISLVTNGSINLSTEASSAGTVRNAMDTVSVTAGNSGYQLYISVASDNNALVRDGTSDTSSSNIIPASSVTNISAPATLPTNTWGFAVPTSGTGSTDVVNSAGFGSFTDYPIGDESSPNSTFIAVPVKGADLLIAKRTGAANNVSTNVFYGANVTTAKPSGLYKNTVVYTAIGDSTTANLAAVSPSRTNRFSGGEELVISTPSTTALSSISTVTVTVGGETCTSPTVAKNENGVGSLNNITCFSPALATGWHEVVATITTTSDTTETYVVNPGIEYYGEPNYIQDLTATECKALASDSDFVVADRRDNNSYTVRYINDNCWMTSNLRITGTISATDSNFTGNDVNISAGDLTDGNSYDQPRTHVGVDNNNNPTVWYNYAAATVGTITGSSNSADATQDICPSGWRLPTNSEQANITSHKDTFQPVDGGRYVDGQLGGSTEYGLWWSATTYNVATDRYYLMHENGALRSGSWANRIFGLYVRCIRQKTASDMIYMQDITPSIVAATPEGATATLTDKRDKKTYTVAKINGNLWMTRNLAIGCNGINSTYGDTVSSKTLTNVDSNISSDWSTPTALLSTGGNDYTNPKIQCSSTYGAWYNYAAASAGTITGNDNTTETTQDICPKNWRLFTRDEYVGLIGAIGSSPSIFNPVIGGGYWPNGLPTETEYGYWWSSTARNATMRGFLNAHNGKLGPDVNERYLGLYIRCISPSAS